MRSTRAAGGEEEASKEAEQLESYKVPSKFKKSLGAGEIYTLKRVFRELDVNGEGNVDKTELAAVLAQMYGAMTTDEVQAAVGELVMEANQDSDAQSISFKGFLLSMLRARREGRTSTFSSLADKIEARIIKTKGQSTIYVLLVLSFLILVNVSTALFQFLKCDEFSADGGTRSFLVKDYSLDCDGPRYQSYLAYVILMLG